jgi:hypothetical protein
MSSIVYAIFGFIEFLLGFRFLFKLLGANPVNAFVAWVYNLSGPLVSPFLGIFGTPASGPGTVTTGHFELGTVVALIVYAIIGAALARLFWHRPHDVSGY